MKKKICLERKGTKNERTKWEERVVERKGKKLKKIYRDSKRVEIRKEEG